MCQAGLCSLGISRVAYSAHESVQHRPVSHRPHLTCVTYDMAKNRIYPKGLVNPDAQAAGADSAAGAAAGT